MRTLRDEVFSFVCRPCEEHRHLQDDRVVKPSGSGREYLRARNSCGTVVHDPATLADSFVCKLSHLLKVWRCICVLRSAEISAVLYCSHAKYLTFSIPSVHDAAVMQRVEQPRKDTYRRRYVCTSTRQM